MSLMLKMVHAFPRGRTTEELLVLAGASYIHDKRIAALTELDQLARDGLVEKSSDGRWRAKQVRRLDNTVTPGKRPNASIGSPEELIHAANAKFSVEAALSTPFGSEDQNADDVDQGAILRYWRSALRADPRGATTQVLDKHGIEWTLISGRGPVSPSEDQRLRISINIGALAPSFLEALVRREGNENALAVGWPMAVGRKSGVPIFQPVGMLAANWQRQGDTLELSIDADDVLVNPDWVRSAARESGWTRDALADLFFVNDGLGLRAEDFAEKIRSSVASQVRGNIVGEDLASHLDVSTRGIFDSAAIFLPTDSSFTAGAARDLDTIATWPEERISRTALGAALNSKASFAASAVPAIDAVQLNKEQLRAVLGACEAPLTVVTGPPGTGKSQAIVSMAASLLADGGSVLVASKNHQALDAVEERLGALAPNLPFLVRTLNPIEDTDTGFVEALRALIENESATHPINIDELDASELKNAATQRSDALKINEQIVELEFEIADVLERIEVREARNRTELPEKSPDLVRVGIIKRVLLIFRSLFMRRDLKNGVANKGGEPLQGLSLAELRKVLTQLRSAREALGAPRDLIEMGDDIRRATERLLPRVLANRVHLPEGQRALIADLHDDWQFQGGEKQLPPELSSALLSYRPLWLASILGAPRRIPLQDGMFDLVIFDEASQCDIATAVPLLARAKRAVVVGDDRQLSFIAQLGQAQDRNLMQAQGLPVSKMGRFAQSRRSLFDFASRSPNVERVTLRHQYRSAGPIVDYINENFYGGQLQAAYDPKRLLVPKGSKAGLAWQHVPSPNVPKYGNVNSAEVAAISRHVKKLVDDGYQGTIGVITPFRAQVGALEAAIASLIDESKRTACNLKVGTVDGFQGQERDVILFSPCVGPRSPQTGLTFFNRDKRRLNVAISRARAVAIVFGDLDFARSGASKQLRRLAAIATESRGKIGEGVFDSDWERRVFHALKARGLEPFPQHEIAGRRLDFALFGANGVQLDLEVDGRKWHESPDGRRKTSDLWRDHQLKSLGWRVRRFWVDELARDMEGCIDRVEQDLS